MRNRKYIEILIHIVGWVIVFAFPFLMMNRSGFTIDWMGYLHHGSIVPISFIVVFYVNYFLLIPRLLFEGKVRQFILFNLAFIGITAWGSLLWQTLTMSLHEAERMPRPERPHPPQWLFMLRDIFSMVLTAGLSTAIRLASRWREMDNARREAERIRTEAELTNLRNQLNPHFLLNTLNNIYALIAIDSEKAQLAVEELSKLLRYVLYDNQQATVPLHKEMEFIRNYIELMRIRLGSHVKVNTAIDIPADSGQPIAPLIFISLIENAFKHGISPTQPSFIDIHFWLNKGCVECEITNTNFPKSRGDKSGSGIGLEQIQRRLELNYAGHYLWQKGPSPDGTTYHSRLIIETLSDSKKATLTSS